MCRDQCIIIEKENISIFHKKFFYKSKIRKPNAECPVFRVHAGYKPTEILIKEKQTNKKTNKKLEKKKEQRTTNHGLPGVHLP